MKILIISGAGFFAGNHVYSKIVQSLKSVSFQKDCDYPEIVLYNYPFRSIDFFGKLDKSLAQKEVDSILNQISSVDKVLIACNTLHLIELNHDGLISLPKGLLSVVNDWGDEKGLLLCSQYSMEQGLFNHEKLAYPDNNMLNIANKLIESKISNKDVCLMDYKDVFDEYIKKHKITRLVIACTELSMFNWGEIVDIPVLDSTDIAIEKLTKDWSRHEGI